MTETDHWKQQVEHWTSKVAEYTDKLRHAEKKLDEARVALAPFKVGDVVEASSRGDDWQPAIVRKVDPQSWGPWYVVSFAKKNGDWSTSNRQVFEKVRALGANSMNRGDR